MVVSMCIPRCKNVCSGDYARCLSIAIMPRPRERRRAQHHDTDTTADPTRCAAHRLQTAVTASVTGGLVAKLRGRYNRTPLHATISLTMTLITAARRICWRFWQHTGQVMTSPVFTALLSASESPQACHAPTVLVSIGPTAGLIKKSRFKTTFFAYGPGHLVRSGVLVKKTRNGKGPRRSRVHRPGAFGAAIDASLRDPKAPIYWAA